MSPETSRSQVLSHEDIVRSFLASKSVDFTALGKFVADQGASIARTGRGNYGVIVGHYNILACFNILGPDRIRAFDVADGALASEVAGR